MNKQDRVGREVYHSVLSVDGRGPGRVVHEVMSAGEGYLDYAPDGSPILKLDNHSGHYLTPPWRVQMGEKAFADAFRELGLSIPIQVMPDES